MAATDMMPQTEEGKEALGRYTSLAHAVQTGVEYEMQWDKGPTSPKHLRVGVNSALIEGSALAEMLVDKGIITTDEYWIKLAELWERETASYEARLRAHYGGSIQITLG